MKKARKAALDALDSLPDIELLTEALEWRTYLRQTPIANTRPALTPQKIEQHGRQVFKRAFTDDQTDFTGGARQWRWSAEVSALLIESGRSMRDARQQVIHVLKTSNMEQLTLKEVLESWLWPKDYDFAAMVGITGTRKLADLSKSSTSNQIREVDIKVKGGFSWWGQSGGSAATYARSILGTGVRVDTRLFMPAGPDYLVQVQVSAKDPRAAATKAIDVASQTLDLYVASHPRATLKIHPLVAVARKEDASSFKRIWTNAGSLKTVKPIEAVWPSELVLPLGVFNLARGSTAPVNCAALCWLTIESAGFGGSIDKVGKAIALHLLRQSVFLSYRAAVSELGANRDLERYHTQRQQDQLRIATSLEGDLPGKKKPNRVHKIASPEMQARLAEVKERRKKEAERRRGEARKHASLADLARREAEFRTDLITRLGVMQPETDIGSNGAARLADFDGWLNLAHSAYSDPLIPAAGVTTAQMDAFRSLLARTSGVPKLLLDRVGVWTTSPTDLVQELTDLAASASGCLKALNTSRNMSFHEGVQNSPGATHLAASGLSIVDNMFEFLSAWYKTSEQSPPSIIELLAQRFDLILTKLESGVPLKDLDVANVAGTAWQYHESP